MGRRTLEKVRDGSRDLWRGLVRVRGCSGRSLTVQETLGLVRDVLEDTREVRVGSGEPRSGAGRFIETLREVRDGSGDLRVGPGLVGGPSGRSGRVGGPSESLEQIVGPSGRTGTCGGTLGEVRNGSSYPRLGLGWFVRPSGRSETGLGTLREVRDSSGDPQGGPGPVGDLGEVRDGLGDTRGGLR